MFTGLVESVGQLSAVVEQPPGRRLVITAPSFRDDDPARDVKLGDSIAINGCCLTVVEIDGDKLSFEAGEETLSRTNLGELTAESTVNLERSLAVGDRMGGHYVTGHVDCVGQLIERIDDPPWANLKFSVPAPYPRQIVAKGSITVDGISLTVVDVGEDYFTVALIPHTLDATTLGRRRVGDHINLETDLLAKYVQRTLQFGNASDPPSAGKAGSSPNTPWSPQS
ncbi:MAG TPA: riboflavin synthase [Rhodopirellula baltica]|nr:riboflavin synthase [Rhodopirellula baltica]HBE64630.1 riboflavin synthase [Rhodopirellula baltica]